MSEKIKLRIDPKGRDNSWQQLGVHTEKNNQAQRKMQVKYEKAQMGLFPKGGGEVAACSAPLLLPTKTGGKHAKSRAKKSDINLEDKVSFRKSRVIL